MGSILRWVVVIGGFTQTRYSGGLCRIWLALCRRHPESEVRVTSHPWNDDWRGLANLIEQELRYLRPEHPVDIVCYSWGCGYGAMRLSRALKGLGIRVRVIVACDGVSRPWLARWRAVWSPILGRLIGQPTISVPSNVKRLVYIKQQTNYPRGHDFRSENGTVYVNRGWLDRGYTHQDADDSREFFDLVMEEVG